MPNSTTRRPRGEFNAVVAGLQAALIDDAEEPALETLKNASSRQRTAKRLLRDAESRCRLPNQEKSVSGDLIGVLGEVVGAVVTVWKELGDDDQVRRTNLRTALEDVKWPKFSEILP